MGKRGKDRGKEGELANFPEEQSTTLLSPRHLAIATSLLLVFSAFASLLIDQDITGQATSATMQRWRGEGWDKAWERYQNNPVTNDRDVNGKIIVPNNYRCPKEAITPPEEFIPTKNSNNCVNGGGKKYANYFLPVCFYINEEGNRMSTKCLPS